MKKTFGILILASFVLIGLAPQVGASGRPLHASLSSANEVPDSGTDGSGSASLTLNSGQSQICFDIEVSDLAGTIVAGHIHSGEAGTNGGVVVNLNLAADNLNACVDADSSTIKAIRKSPHAYYINVHTTAVGSGEIRGQLAK